MVSRDMDLRVDDRDLKSLAEIGTMIANSHTTLAPLASDTIDSVFEEQVRRDPNCIALTQDGVQITYGELNQRADALTSLLLRNGVTLETTVGICLERSIEMIVAILAVLKAGGAYVPLDPTQPVSRLEYFISDSAPIVVITTSCLRARLPVSFKNIISIDQVTVGEGFIGCARRRSTRNSLAYVIYTSGSTGAPKGVMVEHGSVTRFIRDIEELVHPTAQDTWVLVHSFAFDFSVLELWGSLLYGGRLVVASYAIVRTPTEFLELLCAEGATVVSQTPSAFRQLVAAQEIRSTRPPLRVIILGGEAVDLKSVGRWQKLLGASESSSIVNMYGPTETTVFVTAKELSTQDAVNITNSSPIGAPLSGASIHIRDVNLQPVAAGSVGEIFVSGAGVARGYFNRPELTAQRFVACPVDTKSMARMYRTGDRGREHPDGQLEYLGRNDFQVKIRGFRVEFGEIEAHLLSHPNVDEAVVTIREDDVPGEKRLVAYMTPRDAMSPPCLQDLRAHLKAVLPEYMIPAAFVMIERFPLSPNGKLDRRALPAPDFGAFATCEYEPPQGPVEQALAAIWSDVLGIKRVGRQHNFFEVGGDSLLLVKLVSRASKEFSVHLHVQSLFKAACLWEMAALVSASYAERSAERRSGVEEEVACLSRESEVSRETRIPKRESFRPIPLTAMQKLWVRSRGKAGRRVLRGPTSVTRITGLLDLALFRTSVTFLADRHEMLRTGFIEKGGTYWHHVYTTFKCQLDVVDLTQSSAKDIEVHSIINTLFGEEVDILVGPLFVLKLVRLSDREHVMILGLDHMISDGVSSDILLRELSITYNDLACGSLPSLPELPIQFGDYAVWQQETCAVWYDTHAKYWTNRLAGARPTRIPVSDGLREESDPTSVELYFELDETLSSQLRLIARREKVFLAIVMLTVYVIVMHRWCDQDDILVTVPSDGRSRPELENIIGFVTTVLLLRIGVHKSDTFQDLLRRISEEFFAAYAHSGPERLSDGPEGKTGAVPYDTDLPFNWTPLRGERLMIDAAKIESGKSIRFEPYPYHEPDEPTKFAFHCFDGINGVYCKVTYRADFFTKGTIETFWHNLQRISEVCARHPDATISMMWRTQGSGCS